MAKFIALILAATAAVMVQAQSCTPNSRLCGSVILTDQRCLDIVSLTLLTPAGNDPNDCIFTTNEQGEPQARGACCCAKGRCSSGQCI